MDWKWEPTVCSIKKGCTRSADSPTARSGAQRYLIRTLCQCLREETTPGYLASYDIREYPRPGQRLEHGLYAIDMRRPRFTATTQRQHRESQTLTITSLNTKYTYPQLHVQQGDERARMVWLLMRGRKRCRQTDKPAPFCLASGRKYMSP